HVRSRLAALRGADRAGHDTTGENRGGHDHRRGAACCAPTAAALARSPPYRCAARVGTRIRSGAGSRSRLGGRGAPPRDRPPPGRGAAGAGRTVPRSGALAPWARGVRASRALQAGDYVVHLEHGIGLYRGIQTIAVGSEGGTLEVAVVEYESGDRLNVPLYRLDQLEPYRAAGNGDTPPPKLHRLGATTW